MKTVRVQVPPLALDFSGGSAVQPVEFNIFFGPLFQIVVRRQPPSTRKREKLGN